MPLTLIALTALALLAGTGLMLARLENRSADQALAATQATAAAEGGLELAAGSWPTESWDTLPPGATVASGGGASNRQLLADSITHLGALLYLQTGFGEVNDAGGHQWRGPRWADGCGWSHQDFPTALRSSLVVRLNWAAA